MNEADRVETGIVEASAEVITAMVNPATGLTPQGLEAVKALARLPDDLTPTRLMQLARDLAIDIQTVPNILAKHGITQAQFEYLSIYNEFFKNALASQATEWQGVKGTADRLAAQAAAALEEQMPTLASRMGSKAEKLVDAVEAAKLFATIARVDGKSGDGRRNGEGFTITIDLGADTRVVVGTAPAADTSAVTAHAAALPEHAQGMRDAPPLRDVTPRTSIPKKV